MKKKEILQMFYDEMNPFFQKWGFKYTRTTLKAKKKEGYVENEIYFDANYFLGRASFQPRFGVRDTVVMKIRSRFNDTYNSPVFSTVGKWLPAVAGLFGRPELDFLGEDLGNYKFESYVPDKSMPDVSEFDCGSYVYDRTMPFFKERFVLFMEEVGLQFFDQFYTHRDFDRWFNDGIFEGKYGYADPDSDPMYSLILAHLVDNPEKDKIFDYWYEYGLYKEAKQELVQIKKWLDKNDISSLG